MSVVATAFAVMSPIGHATQGIVERARNGAFPCMGCVNRGSHGMTTA